MSKTELLDEWKKRVEVAQREAHEILSRHEGAVASRAVLLEDLLSQLSGLPVDVQSYFREAVVCVENNLSRAAIVLSWSGFFHVLAERLYSEKESQLRALRNKWQFSDLEELKANYPEYQILEAAKKLNLIGKQKLREYNGQLSRRNRCAHPTLYKPSLNSTIGFVDDMLRQTKEHL